MTTVKERFLTSQWNNLLSLITGIPILAYTGIVLSTSLMSEFTGFTGMVISGVFY